MAQSTANILAKNNEVIEQCQGETRGDDEYFWSLCRPRYTIKTRTCLCCGKDFKSHSIGHRMCAKCGAVKGPKDGRMKSNRSLRA